MITMWIRLVKTCACARKDTKDVDFEKINPRFFLLPCIPVMSHIYHTSLKWLKKVTSCRIRVRFTPKVWYFCSKRKKISQVFLEVFCFYQKRIRPFDKVIRSANCALIQKLISVFCFYIWPKLRDTFELLLARNISPFETGWGSNCTPIRLFVKPKVEFDIWNYLWMDLFERFVHFSKSHS